ncbi:VG15 protein [Kitasatospora sp. NPDC003701]
MAITDTGAVLTSAQYEAQARIGASLAQAVVREGFKLDLEDPRALVQFGDIVDELTGKAFDKSADLGARYYGRFTMAEGIDAELVIPDVLRWSSPGATPTLQAFAVATTPETGITMAAGQAVKEALWGGRGTVLDAVWRDKRCQGYQVKTRGRPCSWCAMQAGRGIKYKTERRAGNWFHGHCKCTTEPAFPGSRSVGQAREWSDLYGDVGRYDFRRAYERPELYFKESE